jgi:hypothetical protein
VVDLKDQNIRQDHNKSEIIKSLIERSLYLLVIKHFYLLLVMTSS